MKFSESWLKEWIDVHISTKELSEQLTMAGLEVDLSGDYPGWQPNKDSAILDIMSKLYRDSFDEEPKIKACHAGLECGILLKHLPEVDMISFGPNIRAAHSPDEKCQISSVQKYWGYLIDTLQLIPAK